MTKSGFFVQASDWYTKSQACIDYWLIMPDVMVQQLRAPYSVLPVLEAGAQNNIVYTVVML